MRSQHRINKPTTALRRLHRRNVDDQFAAHFARGHGNTGNEDAHHGLFAPAPATQDDDAMMDSLRQDGNTADADAELGSDRGHNHHGPHVEDALEHGLAPMAPMIPTHHHQDTDIDALTAPELHDSGLLYAAAAASDLQQPASPPLPEGSTMPALQPLVAATDFQPNPPAPASQPHPPPQPQFELAPPAPAPTPSPPASPQPAAAAAAALPPPPQQSVRRHRHDPSPLPSSPEEEEQDAASSPGPQTTTEKMAQDSGYEGFKVDSTFAKRMARDPGQRLAEQRREGQELNLVRRSNVEALFAQIAGTETINPCSHCKKGQGPWTVCVVYAGQMMGSCANCWFNASGSRCSFHEKSQPPQPAATHPYAVPGPLPGSAAAAAAGNGDPTTAPPPGSGSGASPAQLQAAALWNASNAIFSHDAGVKGTVQSALLQVREATPYQRALIEVEVAAKALALKIVAAEELAGGLGPGDGDGGDAAGHHHRLGGGEGHKLVRAGSQQQQQQQQQHNLEHDQHAHEYDGPPGHDGVVDGRS